MKKKFLIWRPDYSETVEDGHLFECIDLGELQWVGEKYANHYWSHHDGWECSWPIEFHIADSESNFLGVVEVDMQTEPVFSGSLK